MNIYENTIKAIGSNVSDFIDTGIIILFGDNAPEELKDYCYSVDVLPIRETIEAGDIISFDQNEYVITAIGSEAQKTLEGLGHCTINFSGQDSVELPGTIYVEKKDLPNLSVGSQIKIIKK